ncbi:germination protein YpeB [Evansella sp. LMS18]|uniref:germination protein YpeB n=1 Tax=Evansella sp. LMS18 TaxID=2924033 RepID=UPI0034E9611A
MMVRSVLIGVLAIALIGTGFWGWGQQEEKNAILLQNENNYQRAFHELSYHVDMLHDELGATLAMNSKERLSPSLAEVWRLTAQAQTDLGQLPLGMMPFSKTEEFLYKIGQYSYQNAIRDLDQDPLTDEEYKNLQKLYEQAGEVQGDIRKVQSMVLRDNLKWTDVELELASQQEPYNNSVINGFEMLDETVGGFSEVDFGAGTSEIGADDKAIAKNLKGKNVSEREAIKKAHKFMDIESSGGTEISESGEGLEYKAYTITIPDAKHGTNIVLDMTRKGGEPVWMLNERDIDEQDISLNEASEKAERFLERNGYENMQLTDSRQYDNIGVFKFAEVLDNVRVYSDSISVEVALDEGDIIGFEAFAYLEHHRDREVEEPKLTKEEAEERLNPNLEVMEYHLAVIENQLEEEVLCYEFYGVINNDTYRIFINAENGKEEQVEKLANAEPVLRQNQ